MANDKKKQNSRVPTELEGIAKTEDINALDDKVAKCYSQERYEEFQEAVEKITLKTIDGIGREKIKSHAKDSAKEYKNEQGEAKKNFLTPNVISAIACLIAIAGLILAILRK